MVALLTYPAALPALRTGSSRGRERTRAAVYTDGVWELHRIINNPVSSPEEITIAKQQLLRALRKSTQFPIRPSAPAGQEGNPGTCFSIIKINERNKNRSRGPV